MMPLPPDSIYRRMLEWRLMMGAGDRPSCHRDRETDEGLRAAACAPEATGDAAPPRPRGPRRLLRSLRGFLLQTA